MNPIALIEAQRLTGELAQGALPDSPVRDEPVATTDPAVQSLPLLRCRLSATLRRLADLVEPAPECPVPVSECR